MCGLVNLAYYKKTSLSIFFLVTSKGSRYRYTKPRFKSFELNGPSGLNEY